MKRPEHFQLFTLKYALQLMTTVTKCKLYPAPVQFVQGNEVHESVLAAMPLLCNCSFVKPQWIQSHSWLAAKSTYKCLASSSFSLIGEERRRGYVHRRGSTQHIFIQNMLPLTASSVSLLSSCLTVWPELEQLVECLWLYVVSECASVCTNLTDKWQWPVQGQRAQKRMGRLWGSDKTQSSTGKNPRKGLWFELIQCLFILTGVQVWDITCLHRFLFSSLSDKW